MNEKQLLTGLISSDNRAFSIFFNTYWKEFFLYTNRILNDEEESVDILQDTFATIWENRKKLMHVQSLKAYMYTIIHHKAVKSIKKNSKQRQLIQDLYHYFPDQTDKPLEEINAKELADFIQKEIQQLSPRMREIFLLSRDEQLSYKEIAQRLSISENTVKKQVSLSLKQLRKGIDKVYFAKSVGAISVYKALVTVIQM
ncbi:RNA polymerase sigma factor [Sphingobacterium chungjuense]|uniref:RNA polymerase sigma factor n=1 Tax=Sphingobacterium chungjuense TaxID=2675553 RepID=UPI001409C974|nr:RNA polymerase sigma-70 factor [Sphingobacterium chungjuense]